MNKTETNKTARQILFEHGIDIMYLEDDFNCQLFHAMERYKETAAPPPASEGEKAGMVSIEGQAELHANEYYEKGSNSEREMAEHELWLNRKYNFMAGAKWALATLPTREPEVKLVDQIEALRISELDKAKQYKRQFLTKVYHNENARALERVIKMLNDE